MSCVENDKSSIKMQIGYTHSWRAKPSLWDISSAYDAITPAKLSADPCGADEQACSFAYSYFAYQATGSHFHLI
jgi:hypothetical protein